MKRITYWALTTVTALVLLFGYRTSTSGPMAASSLPAIVATGSSSGTDSTAATSKTVSGSVAMTQWGPVQVQLTVESGSITNVSVLQYPSGNGRDAEINGYALPILTQETIDAQSGSIDMVSGATVTSVGYLQSLQSALDQANL